MKGFTLIELLVVVLIIGILAAVAVPQYQKAVDKACAVEIRGYFKMLEEAGHMFTLANGRGPLTLDELLSSATGEFSKMEADGEKVKIPVSCRGKTITIGFGVMDNTNWNFGGYVPNSQNATITYQFFKHYGYQDDYLVCSGYGKNVGHICSVLTGAAEPAESGSYVRP